MILDLTKFSEYIPSAIGTDSNEIASFRDFAELRLKEDILGAALYDYLNTSTSEADKTVQDLCSNALAHRTYYDSIPFRDVIQTTNGFAIVSNANQAPASKERVAAVRAQAKTMFSKYIDAVILLVETTETYRTKWIGTLAHAKITDCIFYTAFEFNGDTEGIERDVFLKKKPEIISLQNALIAKTISRDLLAHLLTNRAAGTPFSVKETSIFSQVQTIARLYFSEEESSINNMHNMVEQLSSYLDDNMTDFPAYASSKEYAAKIAPKYENTLEKPMFFGPVGAK